MKIGANCRISACEISWESGYEQSLMVIQPFVNDHVIGQGISPRVQSWIEITDIEDAMALAASNPKVKLTIEIEENQDG